MFLNTKTAACFFVILTCWCLRAVTAQRAYPATACVCGPDGRCTPRRETYGYYPTTWRRWPSEGPTVAAPPEPERLPTPAAQEELPTIESETPPAPGEEGPLKPTEREPFVPAPKEDTPLTPSFEDTPPEPPKESGKEPELEPQLPDDTNKDAREKPNPEESRQAPSEIQLPSEIDSPPNMPDGDPFKDDEEEPPTDSTRRNRPKTWSANAGRQTTMHTRSAAAAPLSLTAEGQADAVVPSLLQPLPVEVDVPDQLVPVNGTPAKRNPLRAEVSETRHVVPAGGRVITQASAEIPVAAPRRNPLRAN